MPGDIWLSITIRQNLLLSQTRGKHTEEHIFCTECLSGEHPSPVTVEPQWDFQEFPDSRGPSVHHGLFDCPLLQEQLLLFRADHTVQPTPGLELMAVVAVAFGRSSFGCSTAGSSDRQPRENLPKSRSEI